MPGVPQPPLIREGDPNAAARTTQYLQDLNRMARSMTFLTAAGGFADGQRSLNLDAVWVLYVSSGTANTETSVAHNLGRIPLGAFVGLPDISATIYAGTTAWSSTLVYFRSTAATTTVRLLLF